MRKARREDSSGGLSSTEDMKNTTFCDKATQTFSEIRTIMADFAY